MKPCHNGLFVALEGIDGAGKSTLVEAMAQFGHERGRQVHTTREPGGTRLAESIRQLLLDPGGEALLPEVELLLHFAARATHVKECIAPALGQGQLVITERFTASTYAYQGSGLGVDPELIAAMETGVLHGVQPDLVILLDLPVADARKRLEMRGGPQDRYQRRPEAFSEAVRQGYLELARGGNQRGGRRYHVLDAARTQSAVNRDACKLLETLL